MDFLSQDAYEQFLDTTLPQWPATHRAALAAAMTERWLPHYEAFSKAQKWGDGPALRRVLDRVWEHLKSRGPSSTTLATAEAVADSARVIGENTPHMDDFDAPAALAACVMLEVALQSAITDANSDFAIQGMISGFEAVAPTWESEETEEARRWRRPLVQRELKKQLKLLEQIGSLGRFDETTIRTLRKTFNSKSLAGELATTGKANAPAKDAAGRTLLSNQTIFEQYRRMIEADLKNSDDWWQKEYAPGSTQWAMMIVAAWSSRYSRRRQTIDGTYGPFIDTTAQQALVARQRELDAVQTGIPNWETGLLEMLDIMLRNPHGGLDVTTLESPHAFGPSLRALWWEAHRQVHSAIESWNHILSWARHRPPAWLEADRLKKQKQRPNPLLDHFNLALIWQPTGNAEYPWACEFEAASYRIRLNDFPDAFMYTLFINNASVGDFNDWPESWQRQL